MMNQQAPEIWPFVPRYQEIPSLFHSLEFNGPFERCIVCRTDLMTSGNYFVERIFRGQEPIVEYAMCSGCQSEFWNELSLESRQRIEGYFASLDMEGRLERLRPFATVDDCVADRNQAGSLRRIDIEPWIDRCFVTGKPLQECNSYQVVGTFLGGKIELGIAPLMLSDDAAMNIAKLMSKKTRDRLEDFLGTHFGMPPEFCGNPSYWPILV